jgi:hypothetical protein
MMPEKIMIQVKPIDKKQQINYLAKTLKSVITSKDIKLAWGSHQREQIKRALKAGKQISGYRAEWLIETKRKLATTLNDALRQFNQANKHDMISTNDLEDVVMNLLGDIVKK